MFGVQHSMWTVLIPILCTWDEIHQGSSYVILVLWSILYWKNILAEETVIAELAGIYWITVQTDRD